MNEVIDLILTFSQELKEIKARIKLSIAERLKITWIDNQDVQLQSNYYNPNFKCDEVK